MLVRTLTLAALLMGCIFPVELIGQSSPGILRTKPYGDEAFLAVQEFFRYDRALPFQERVVSREDRGSYILEKFVFTSSGRIRVPGLLAVPKTSKAKHPCMILIHSGTGRKEDWWSDQGWVRGLAFVEKLLQAGYAVVAIDAEGHGERAASVDYMPLTGLAYESKETYTITRLLVQTTVDHLRLVDYLRSKPLIDADRIGVMGYSIGGMIGTYLCTQLPQLKLAVLCASGSEFAFVSPAIYPLHFAPRIKNIPVLLLDGKDDTLFPAKQVEDFGRLFQTQKKLVFYASGHMLPVTYLDDAFEWINMYLK